MSNLKITLEKGYIRCLPKQRQTLEALGLKKIRQSTIQEDSKSLQGMLRIVGHLVKVEAAV